MLARLIDLNRTRAAEEAAEAAEATRLLDAPARRRRTSKQLDIDSGDVKQFDFDL